MLHLAPLERKRKTCLSKNCLSLVLTAFGLSMACHRPTLCTVVRYRQLGACRHLSCDVLTLLFLAGRTYRTAPAACPDAKGAKVASQFSTAVHSFTTPHETSFPVKAPRLGTPGNPARMGELPHRASSASSDRSEWTRLPSSPDFYGGEKVVTSAPRTLFSRVSRTSIYICLSLIHI